MVDLKRPGGGQWKTAGMMEWSTASPVARVGQDGMGAECYGLMRLLARRKLMM